jgi:hypothetical protein
MYRHLKPRPSCAESREAVRGKARSRDTRQDLVGEERAHQWPKSDPAVHYSNGQPRLYLEKVVGMSNKQFTCAHFEN